MLFGVLLSVERGRGAAGAARSHSGVQKRRVGVHRRCNFALLFFLGHLWHGSRTLFRDVFSGIGAEVTEQVEFGAFQKLGDRSTKKQGAV